MLKQSLVSSPMIAAAAATGTAVAQSTSGYGSAVVVPVVAHIAQVAPFQTPDDF
jgi:hypothetical protein